jgi:hypothetical protein
VPKCAPRYEGMGRIKDVFHVLGNLTLGGGQHVISSDTCFTSEKVAPNTHITGAWVDPRTGLDTLNNTFLLPGIHNLFLFAFILSVIMQFLRKLCTS